MFFSVLSTTATYVTLFDHYRQQLPIQYSRDNQQFDTPRTSLHCCSRPMAAAAHLSNCSGDADSPLLDDFVDGSVDHKGQPVRRSRSGGWRSAGFIIVVEFGERFAYVGIAANLINYLTGPLGQSTVVAAENVNIWDGVGAMLPLLGGFVADSYLGRYRTIIFASLLYILGLSLLTLSAVLTSAKADIMAASTMQFEVVLFFFSVYLVAIAQGGHKPCVQAFAADQFDGDDPVESKAKSSFFNWWFCGYCAGASATILIVVYIQDNFNWSLGFAIPCIAMVVALVVFLLGTKNYRYSIHKDENNPFLRIGKVFVSAVRNWTIQDPSSEEESHDLLQPSCEQFKFLNKALLKVKESEVACSINDVEEAKSVLRLIPIWCSSLVYAIVAAQISTFFTKQGVTMDRTVTSEIKIPAASLLIFIGFTIVILMPIYERVFVPVARVFTNKPSGISTLQRIGIGFFFSICSVIFAALIEMKRLEIVREYGLIDSPELTVPMSIWWMIPQYVLFGFAQVFTMVGLQEFFYDQVPEDLRSIGIALSQSVYGVGHILSSVLIFAVEKMTTCNGGDGWFLDNLNKAHLDYFYLLLAGMSVVGLASFTNFSRSYIYRRQ